MKDVYEKYNELKNKNSDVGPISIEPYERDSTTATFAKIEEKSGKY